MIVTPVICERCHTEPSEGWPGSQGGELCQDCWEIESSDAWWDEVKRVEDYLESLGIALTLGDE